MLIATATTSTRMSAGIQVRTANYCRQATGSAGSLTRIVLAAVAAGVGERAHYAGPGCTTGRPASLCIARATLAVVPEVPLSLHPDYVTHVECAWAFPEDVAAQERYPCSIWRRAALGTAPESPSR
jgi:hypothetical protein